jgi:hypothetical protein
MENVAGYFYRNRTAEGKIYSLPKKIEVLETMISLKKSLEEAGIDSSDFGEKVEQSAILLAEEYTKLLSDEPSITLNAKY